MQETYDNLLAQGQQGNAKAFARRMAPTIRALHEETGEAPLFAIQLGVVQPGRGRQGQAGGAISEAVSQRLAALEERLARPSATVRDVVLRTATVNRAVSRAAADLDLDDKWLETEAYVGERDGQQVTGSRRDALEIYLDEHPDVSPDMAILTLFRAEAFQARDAKKAEAIRQEAVRNGFAGGSPAGSRTTPFQEPKPNEQLVETLQQGATARLQYRVPVDKDGNRLIARRVYNPGAGRR